MKTLKDFNQQVEILNEKIERLTIGQKQIRKLLKMEEDELLYAELMKQEELYRQYEEEVKKIQNNQ